MTTTSALHVAGLQKQFKSRQVVKNVSLDINSGEVVACLGQMVPVKPPVFT